VLVVHPTVPPVLRAGQALQIDRFSAGAKRPRPCVLRPSRWSIAQATFLCGGLCGNQGVNSGNHNADTAAMGGHGNDLCRVAASLALQPSQSRLRGLPNNPAMGFRKTVVLPDPDGPTSASNIARFNRERPNPAGLAASARAITPTSSQRTFHPTRLRDTGREASKVPVMVTSESPPAPADIMARPAVIKALHSTVIDGDGDGSWSRGDEPPPSRRCRNSASVCAEGPARIAVKQARPPQEAKHQPPRGFRAGDMPQQAAGLAQPPTGTDSKPAFGGVWIGETAG